MKQLNKYNVYYKDKLYLKEKTADEISNAICCSAQAVRNAAIRNNILHGKFEIKQIVFTETTPKYLSGSFQSEWNKMREMYKNVVWVKQGGKILRVSHSR